MVFGEKVNYYDVLELAPDATPQEIREAYTRLKSAYGKDSVALYNLISKEDTDDVRGQIEEAYQVLSNPERRKEYDRGHGVLDPEHMDPPVRAQKKIISIDRVPPMESDAGEDELLVAPSTDFESSPGMSYAKPAPKTKPAETFGSPVDLEAEARVLNPAPRTTQSNQMRPAPAVSAAAEPTPTPVPTPVYQAPVEDTTPDGLSAKINDQVEWRGIFLKEIREARNISIEEMADYTKISRSYLRAIEEDDFDKLPAPVYIRGFVVQIAKKLKLPHEKVALAYLARYRQMAESKKA
ncbi:MAG: helix-turn-helix domain-containing protein [Bacteriovoracia bacterium]